MILTAEISLQQAINAEPLKLQTLDGRLLSIPADSIISPKTVLTVEGEGMPIFKDRKEEDEETKKGNLYVKFNIKFPKALNQEQRARIEGILRQEA